MRSSNPALSEVDTIRSSLRPGPLPGHSFCIQCRRILLIARSGQNGALDEDMLWSWPRQGQVRAGVNKGKLRPVLCSERTRLLDVYVAALDCHAVTLTIL